LVRFFSFFLFGNYLLAAFIVSTLAVPATFILLYELVQHDFGNPTALRTVIYLAAFPTSFYLAAYYSEGLFLALTLGAFLAARRYHNWWLVGLLLALATITRNMGILLVIPLGWEWWRQHRAGLVELSPAGKWRFKLDWPKLQPQATLALAGFPVLFYGGWLTFNAVALGNPFTFVSAVSQPPWYRRTVWPWETVGMTIGLISRPPLPPDQEDHTLLNTSFWLFAIAIFLAACYLAWQKRLPFAYLLYFSVALLLPMSGPSLNEPLLSFPRYILLAFPLPLVLALLGRRLPIIHYLYLMFGFPLLTLMFMMFANWYWIG
jgi:4-amino-4-deoxy-L-arabinose transferase-like glycosyltransferase